MLRDQAKLNLPIQYAFLPEAAARNFMQRLGNRTDENFLGIILPQNESNWFSILEFYPSGYIKDEEGKDIDADAMLRDIRENTEEGNKVRKARGIHEMEVLGWIEKPHYDRLTHRLIWSISARDKGDTKNSIINYKTLLLGRQGYIAMVLVTDLKMIEAQKPIASLLLSKLSFVGGKRYTDFNPSTDRVAEYGIAALIGGVVAHKLGFFALAAAFLAKSAKFLILVAAGAFAAAGKWLRRKKQGAAPQAEPVDATAPPPT